LRFRFGFKNIFSLPRNPKEFFAWLVIRLFFALGGGYLLGFLALMIVGVAFVGFLVGDYSGNGQGTLSNNAVVLSTDTQAKQHALLKHYEQVAATWEQGLTSGQITQVQNQQVDVPGSVLLAVGKMINNFNPPNAQTYYSYLAPTYTWETFVNQTVTYQAVAQKSKDGKVTTICKASTVNTPVKMLVSATTWDGTLTNTYRYEVTGTQVCASGGKNVWTRRVILKHTTRTYSWSRIWTLFNNVPATDGSKTYVIEQNQTNQQILAGLIATQDYSLADPIVQQMVDVVLFPGQVVSIGNLHVGPASGDTIKNVLRWKDYILAYASKYQVPPVLVAGVMSQESSGNEYDASGQVLISSAGALGLMQVMPGTAAGMYVNGGQIGTSVFADLGNPAMNIEIGTKYLSELYHEFGNSTIRAESAYNAGPGGELQALATGNEVAQNSQTIGYVSNIEGKWIPVLIQYFGAPK